MNHLKHIRSISARASNAALPSNYGQHADIYFENCKLKSQLLLPDPFATKKNHNLDVKYLEQFREDNLRLVSKESKTISKQHSKTKSSVTSLKKKSSMHKKLSENIAKRVCHYSTCQNVKFNNSRVNKQFMHHSDAIVNGTKNVNRHSSFSKSVEKHPRSYAELIADYSESLYKESTVRARNGSFHFNNAIHKSPFCTFSVPPPAKKIMNVAEYSEFSTERHKNDFPSSVKSFDLCNRCNNTIVCYDFHHHGTCAAEAKNKNINQSYVTTSDLKNDDQSYAKLVANCSKSMHNIIKVLNDDLIPKRNMLTRIPSDSVVTMTRKVSGTQETSRKVTPSISTMLFEKNIKEEVIDLKKNDWLKEMKNVMSDLKNVIDKKVVRIDAPKIRESDNLLPTDIPDNSLDRIHELTELKSNSLKENDLMFKKLSQSDKIDRMEKHKKTLELQKHNYSHSSDKTLNPPRYFGNAVENSTVRKNSTYASSSGNTDVLKQPQIKLRMVPSEKESVVSINVDQASGSLDPLNSISKHLSVVVQSDQKENLQLTDNQRNAPTLRRTTKSALQSSNFGPMYISISEDSAPVKQIEFSINGKPVSELKSITARTERLDVVSSVDKIEIRIPFAKDNLNALEKTRESDLSKEINSNLGQILNVQISASFQDELTKSSNIEKPTKTMRYQYDKDTISKLSSSTSSKTPYLSNNFPKTREEVFSNNNIQQYESSKQMIKFNDTEKNINGLKTNTSLIKETNNVEGNLNMRRTNTTKFSEENKYNENVLSDNRVPSKMIPWWSSSDSFNRIKKKENDHRPLIPSSNRNQYEAVSNLNKNFITESSKPKQMSNSKVLTKKSQSMNDTTANDSGNTSSYLIKPYKESKSTLYYTSFRLKPNQGNPDVIPEIVRNGLKAGDNQVLTMKKDINKISGIKQTESTLFKSDTMNIKNKHDINIKGKTTVQEKIKLPNSAQNLSSKIHQEKTNYSLKQTRSIDNVSKNIKSKIKDILDAIKPIEKTEDGILMDYNLKKEMPLRKSTPKLNSAEIQNLVIMAKNFIPNSSIAKILSKGSTKKILTNQTESINTEKLKLKTNSQKKKDLTIKNDATINIKTLNKNDVKNIKEVDKNDFTSLNSRNSPELSQTLNKQEQFTNNSVIFQDKSKQNLKSPSKINKNSQSSLNTSSLRISSGMMQKSEISEKISLEELKQNRLKSLTSIKNTPKTIQEFEKLKNLTSKSVHPSKESSNTIMIDKLPLQTVKQIQLKPSKNTNTNQMANINSPSSQMISTLNTKDRIISKNLIDKNAGETSQSMKTKRTKIGDMVVIQNPKSKNLLSKKCEENCFNKSGSVEGYVLGCSAGSSRKSNDSIDFKSAGSKTKSRVMSNNNCTYKKKLLMESFNSNFNRQNDIVSTSQSAIFKVRQNLNDIDMLEYSASSVTKNNETWINMDRPEKSILYSAWLQRYENDMNKKLF